MSQNYNEAKMKQAPQIRLQLYEGRQRGAQWMIRMRNTATDEIFPLYVGDNRSPRQAFVRYLAIHGDNFDPFECYDLSKDLENQVQDDRCSNWDRQLPVQGGFSNTFPYEGTGPNIKDIPPKKR